MPRLWAAALALTALTAATAVHGHAIPEQVHLAFGGPHAMTVSWFTHDDTATSTVKYGTNPRNLTMTATSPTKALQYLDGHGFHHHVTLTNLPANATIFYQVGDASAEFSSTFQFKTAPDSNTHPFSAAVFGDMGYEGSKERPKWIDLDGLEKNWSAVPTRNLLETLKDTQAIDFIFHIGDIGYMDDAFAQDLFKLEYEDTYNGYMNWLQNLTSVMPYMVAVGNHESECHSPLCVLYPKYNEALRNFTAYNARWHMPSFASDGVLSMWYSFDYGPVHFVVLNTETDWKGAGEENKGDSGLLPAGHFAPDGTYMKWLEADLQKASAARANKTAGYRQWLIAAGHRPIGDITHSGVEELFQKYGVDVYFAGHMHSYARSTPSYKRVVDTKAVKSMNHYHDATSTTYIVAGGAGCDEMNFVADPHTLLVHATPEKKCSEIVPLGTEVEDVATDRVAIGVLDVVNQTALHWRLLDSTDHSELDSLWLTKSA